MSALFASIAEIVPTIRRNWGIVVWKSAQSRIEIPIFLSLRKEYFTVARVAFPHLVCRFKASVGDFSYTKLFMIRFLGWDNRSVSDEWKMNSWVGYQVGLEFSEIHIQSSIKPKRGSNGRHNLPDESVQIGVCWTFNIEITTTNVIDCLNG